MFDPKIVTIRQYSFGAVLNKYFPFGNSCVVQGTRPLVELLYSYVSLVMVAIVNSGGWKKVGGFEANCLQTPFLFVAFLV